MLDQAEVRLGEMIERLIFQERWFPGLRIVAGLAIQLKYPHMHCWFSMTVHTILRQVLKLSLGVAHSAAGLQVRASEREFGGSVVKPGDTVLTIMTGHTAIPEILQMSNHEGNVVTCVAGRAGLG